MTHVLNDDAFVKYFVGENPIFLEYCTPISEPVPFFEAAQGIIEDSTPEGRWLLDLIKDHKSVTIEPKKQEAKHTDAWDKAIAEGAISADAFFDELNSRIDKWPESRA